MRTLLLAVLVPLTLPGQNWPVTLTGEDGPEQSVILHLKNNFEAPLTAYVVGHLKDGEHSWNTEFQEKDVALRAEPDEGTAPGQVADVKITRSSGPASEWKLKAMVFADGTIAGDAGLVRFILDSRVQTYQDIVHAIEMISGKSPSVAAFMKWRNGDRVLKYPSPMEALAKIAVPQQVIKLINDGKSQPEILKLLLGWRDRLEQIRPSIPTKSPPVQGAL